jgi:hypothetical protein
VSFLARLILVSQLQKIDAGDGEKITTHSRWKQFFGGT